MKKLAAILVVLFALFGCNKGPSLESKVDLKPTLMKGPAPEFELENIAGGKTKTADLKGKVLVVDFWATWCDPCIAEIPKFNQMSDEFKGKDVEIVAITVESPHDTIKPKVDETGMKYTVLVGNDQVVDGFGGIIVLEHEHGTPHRFWTFYGHLAPASLADKAIGAALEGGPRSVSSARRRRTATGRRMCICS